MIHISRYKLTFNCIHENCFPQQPHLANLVHQYSYDVKAPSVLLHQIAKTQANSSNLLVEHLTDTMRQGPGFEKCTIKNVDTVIKVCRYMMTNPSAFKKKPAFFEWTFSTIPKKVFLRTKNVQSGNSFVLTEMQWIFTYHTNRNPKEDRDEKEHNKFIVNPQRNQFFNFADTTRLITTAVRLGLEVPKLHSELLVPRQERPPKGIETSSLQEYYQCAQLAHLAEITQ